MDIVSLSLPRTIPFWARCISQFPLVEFTIRHRRFLASAEESGLVGQPMVGSESPNFCPWASHPHECHS